MGHKRYSVVGAVAVVLAAAMPAQAGVNEDAEAIKRLDIMLMVSSLRCRYSSDDFQQDYHRFSARHLSALNEAHRTMKADYNRRFGAKGGKRELDRVSTSMANRYGLGHPWMDCAELKQVTAGLADQSQSNELHLAASDLLADRPQGDRVALVARYR